MKIRFYKHTLSYVLLFISLLTFAQKKYDSNASEAKITLEGKDLVGYETTFDFAREEVRKGWWKYAKAFGNPLNMKSYYKVTVPSETNEGNVDLVIFSQTIAGESGGSLFSLGIADEKYKQQALALIVDFKKKFYISSIAEAIQQKQEKADNLSDRYVDEVLDTKKSELLNQIAILATEITQLKKEIKAIERG